MGCNNGRAEEGVHSPHAVVKRRNEKEGCPRTECCEQSGVGEDKQELVSTTLLVNPPLFGTTFCPENQRMLQKLPIQREKAVFREFLQHSLVFWGKRWYPIRVSLPRKTGQRLVKERISFDNWSVTNSTRKSGHS